MKKILHLNNAHLNAHNIERVCVYLNNCENDSDCTHTEHLQLDSSLINKCEQRIKR